MRQRGITLIELIVTIVIIGIALAGVLGVLSATASRSANSFVDDEATLVAESYLNEILDKPFSTDATVSSCARLDMYSGNYDKLSNAGVQDVCGNSVSNLGGYNVTVSVAASTLGPPGKRVPAKQSELVTVAVTAPSGDTIRLSGYRVNTP